MSVQIADWYGVGEVIWLAKTNVKGGGWLLSRTTYGTDLPVSDTYAFKGESTAKAYARSTLMSDRYPKKWERVDANTWVIGPTEKTPPRAGALSHQKVPEFP